VATWFYFFLQQTKWVRRGEKSFARTFARTMEDEMQYDPEKHHRRSIRLKGHDYAGGGLYFVTLCAHKAKKIFGEIENGQVSLNAAGNALAKCWSEIPKHFPHVTPCEFVVMPDHFHGIVRMSGVVGAKNLSPSSSNDVSKSAKNLPPSSERPHGTSKTLGSVVRGFKIGVTKWCHKNTSVHDVWQRDYYEMIIHNKEMENNIINYIRMNPWKCVVEFEIVVGAKNLSPSSKDVSRGSAKEFSKRAKDFSPVRPMRGIGNPALWGADKLGVLCSRNAPKPDRIPNADVYFGGFHSPMEKEILARLLELKKPVIYCPAWGIASVGAKNLSPSFTKNLSPALIEALKENRMLILEMENAEGNLLAARERNEFVISNADKLWAPYVSKGGMLETLLEVVKGE
jgi:REP element-mobilizing transposase RayT